MQNQVLEAMNNAVETAYQATRQVADINATAMESLVEQGESWMKPLLDFRNMLAETTDQEWVIPAARSGCSLLTGSIASIDQVAPLSIHRRSAVLSFGDRGG